MIETLASLLLHRGWMLVTAESCTGGMVAARCTDLAGSSQWLERGMVTYSNEAKHELLGVDTALIDAHGAVSEEVARAMAIGALRHSRAQVSVAITGIAGPSGGSAAKPVGTVWFAWAVPSDTGPTLGAETAFVRTACGHFNGDRASVRLASADRAIQGLIELLQH
jgi:nicotinamide-nucleotide amidase